MDEINSKTQELAEFTWLTFLIASQLNFTAGNLITRVRSQRILKKLFNLWIVQFFRISGSS